MDVESVETLGVNVNIRLQSVFCPFNAKALVSVFAFQVTLLYLFIFRLCCIYLIGNWIMYFVIYTLYTIEAQIEGHSIFQPVKNDHNERVIEHDWQIQFSLTPSLACQPFTDIYRTTRININPWIIIIIDYNMVIIIR